LRPERARQHRLNDGAQAQAIASRHEMERTAHGGDSHHATLDERVRDVVTIESVES
jgi:hypothetical protein